MATYGIRRYLNIRSAHSPSFGPGELAFLTDTTGVPQVWSLERAEGWPRQRSFHDERVSFVDWSTESGELVYGMDRGGNERTQFYRLVDGVEHGLTQEPEAKHMWGGWSSTGREFAFTSNRRDESSFDVYVQGLDGGAERVHETGGWFSVAAWSPRDDRLVLSESHSNFDQDLYVLDLGSRDAMHVTPHDGDVRYRSVNWVSRDALHLVTDLDSDTLYLACLDLDSLELDAVVDGGDWNVEGVNVDDSRNLVYARNVDGYSEVHSGELENDTEIKEYPQPSLPEGVVGGTSFDHDGGRFAVTFTAATDNANVYVVDVESGKAERWTRASTAGIPRSTFKAPELLRFESFDGLGVPGYLTLPDEKLAPVVVDIHGGPESQRRPSFGAVKQYLVNNGYAVYEPNVRGSTGYGKEYTHLDDRRKRVDSVRDVAEAVGWLSQRDDIDGNRVAAMGGSYGGFMVLAALTEYPELWAAGVDVVGIANFVTFLENTGEWRRALREEEYGSLEDDREFLEDISPINNIEDIDAPLFVLHGENDPRVPVGEAEQIAREAEEHVPVEKLVFPDEGHGISKLENKVMAYGRIVEFLDRYV